MTTLESQAVVRWEQLARRQKIWIVAGLVLVTIVVGSLVWDAWELHSEIHGYENDAAQARRDKEDALAKAANVASQLRVKEQEQAKVEANRDVKANEVKAARSDVDRARDDYGRAQRSHRSETPSTDSLCAELAAAGHPCYPTQ
jgi:hypothetical protein